MTGFTASAGLCTWMCGRGLLRAGLRCGGIGGRRWREGERERECLLRYFGIKDSPVMYWARMSEAGFSPR